MNTSLMTQAQESDVQWGLPEGAALRLSAASAPRVLAVTAGRVWLTQQQRRRRSAPDVWLAAGETARAGARRRGGARGRPRARFTVLDRPLRRRGASVRPAPPLGPGAAGAAAVDAAAFLVRLTGVAARAAQRRLQRRAPRAA